MRIEIPYRKKGMGGAAFYAIAIIGLLLFMGFRWDLAGRICVWIAVCVFLMYMGINEHKKYKRKLELYGYAVIIEDGYLEHSRQRVSLKEVESVSEVRDDIGLQGIELLDANGHRLMYIDIREPDMVWDKLKALIEEHVEYAKQNKSDRGRIL